MKIEAHNTTPIDWDKPIETTEGFPARVISRDYLLSSGERQVIVQVEKRGESSLHYYDVQGTNRYINVKIRNRKTKREGWINISRDQWVGLLHESEEVARRHPNAKGAIATIKIEWEE
jgi:hypothetical protein